MNYSRQRQLIWDAVTQGGGHPTAEELYQRLKPDNPALSLATVYRNLRQLEACGRLRRVAVPDGSDRYDGRLDPHEHMICETCGRAAWSRGFSIRSGRRRGRQCRAAGWSSGDSARLAAGRTNPQAVPFNFT